MRLVEFKNHNNEVLRGLFEPADSKKGVIFLHGFERTTAEMKFKNLRDGLAGRINIFRFDFSGCGLSDGNFIDVTVEKMTKELEKAAEVFKKLAPQVKEIILVGHSIAGCVALNFVFKNPLGLAKIVLLGPALNQQKLLKYYFVRAKMWVKKINIDWRNYREYFTDAEYARDLQIKKRMRKSHWLSNKYFLENQNEDYQKKFQELSFPLKNVLIIHGDADSKVPLQSNDKLPSGVKLFKIKNGDHDLERPDMVKQYLAKTIKFILH